MDLNPPSSLGYNKSKAKKEALIEGKIKKP